MMSSLSPVFSSEPALASGFTTWDASDLFTILDDTSLCPVEVNPGPGNTNSCQIQNQCYPNPGFKDKPFNQTGLNVVLPDKDDRREKRKKSNRESARRSRMKQQKHLEDVRSQFHQLKRDNRELENQLRYAMHHCQHAKIEKDRLRLEHHILQEKLLNLRQVLVLRQIQQSSTCASW
ncbi:hypothetical protein EUTSA_v10005352mg, partial [Eutrema salsugineum]